MHVIGCIELAIGSRTESVIINRVGARKEIKRFKDKPCGKAGWAISIALPSPPNGFP